MEKTCPKCRQTKYFSDFNKNKGRYDGLQGYCRECEHEIGRAYKQSEIGKEKHRMQSRRDRIKNINKCKARDRLNYLIRFNKMDKETCACAEFNWQCSGRVEAHHWDYNKPDEVTWFCKKHHELADRVKETKEQYA